MFDFITDGIDSLMQSIGDFFLYNLIFKALYYIEIGLLYVLGWVESLYKIFTGMDEVYYNDTPMSLLNVFFQNRAVTGVFLAMAAIGIVFAFVSAIAQVIRKAFDSGDKIKSSMGQILGNLLKSILIILSLNVAITVVVTFLDYLMTAVDYEFDNAYILGDGPTDHVFTDEEFAAMGRIFNTIGNYSLNPSYNNRYSINSCYNEIRPDLRYLANNGVFKFYYETKDDDDNIIPTWQSVIGNIANAADYNKEQPVDVYNEGIANSLSDAMTILKSDANLKALDYYQKITYATDSDIGFDRVVFVAATMGMGRTAAAKNSAYNTNPSMTDAVREPYYRGAKDLYKLDQVNSDFDISVSKTNYLVAYGLSIVLIYNMGLIILTAITRIFNMLFLYVIAPPIIGVMPLDDGEKFKQWMTAFIVQAFSIFAIIISMRLYLIFVPIILGPNLVLSQSATLNIFGKVLLLYGGLMAVNKAIGILTGILANQAGYQSVLSGDMSQTFSNTLRGIGSAGAAGAKLGFGAAKYGAKAGWAATKFAAKTGWAVGKAGVNAAISTGRYMFGGGGGDEGAGSQLPDKSNQGRAGSPAGGPAAATGGPAAAAGNVQSTGNTPERQNRMPGIGATGNEGSPEGGNTEAKTPPPMRDIAPPQE